jgi:hypothetical protein
MSGAASALVSEIESEPIDWEAVFEADGHGLIALIGEAKSFHALKDCMAVIVEQLFSRDGDEAFRNSYMADLDAVFPEDLDSRDDAAETLRKLIAVMTLTLRKIKTYRSKKAEQYRQSTAAGAPQPRASPERRGDAGEDAAMLMDAAGGGDAAMLMDAAGGGDAGPGVDLKPSKPDDAYADMDRDEKEGGTDPAVTAAMFAEVVAAEFKNRFKALQMGIEQKGGGKTKLPFMLSAKFAAKFDAVLCEYVIPEFTQRCHEIIIRGATRAADKQKSYLQQFTGFEGGRGDIWEHWRYTWTDVTTKQKLPTRPTGKGKKKKGLFGLGSKKNAGGKDAAAAEMKRWESRIKQMEMTNGYVDAIWDALCAETVRYIPPVRGDDGKILMELFGRSTKSIMKQVHAINQIVQQGGEMARAFEVLQQGKDIEICLLAACFQNPEQFLGRKQVLKQLLGGFKGGHFPLILRYLPQHIRE